MINRQQHFSIAHTIVPSLSLWSLFSYVYVHYIYILGNVQTATVSVKYRDDEEDWTRRTRVPVNEDGSLAWPVTGEFVTIAMLRIEPETATNDLAEYFQFVVDIVGCKGQICKLSSHVICSCRTRQCSGDLTILPMGLSHIINCLILTRLTLIAVLEFNTSSQNKTGR